MVIAAVIVLLHKKPLHTGGAATICPLALSSSLPSFHPSNLPAFHPSIFPSLHPSILLSLHPSSTPQTVLSRLHQAPSSFQPACRHNFHVPARLLSTVDGYSFTFSIPLFLLSHLFASIFLPFTDSARIILRHERAEIFTAPQAFLSHPFRDRPLASTSALAPSHDSTGYRGDERKGQRSNRLVRGVKYNRGLILNSSAMCKGRPPPQLAANSRSGTPLAPLHLLLLLLLKAARYLRSAAAPL